MRILFTAAAVPSHFHIQVPIAHALRDAGHAVAFATGPNVLPRIMHLGFPSFPVGPPHAPYPGEPPADPGQRLWGVGAALRRPARRRAARGPAVTGTRLCTISPRLDLAQPRISTHLALLQRAGLVETATIGRRRTHRVDAERIGAMFTALGGAMSTTISAPKRSAQAARVIQRDMPIRHARTCYDHLAGIAGVQLLDALLECGWLMSEHGPRPR